MNNDKTKPSMTMDGAMESFNEAPKTARPAAPRTQVAPSVKPAAAPPKKTE